MTWWQWTLTLGAAWLAVATIAGSWYVRANRSRRRQGGRS